MPAHSTPMPPQSTRARRSDSTETKKRDVLHCRRLIFRRRRLGFFAAWALVALPFVSGAARSEELRVTNTEQLRSAIENANPGDEIVLLPGDFTLTSLIRVARPGVAGLPITVRAERPGCSLLLVDAPIGFRVSAPHWIFEDLVIRGICAAHSTCEHAFQIVGNADFFVLRQSILRDFNAQIKGNGEDSGSGMVFPNDVVIEGNELFNTGPRMTGNPVTPIDVVGGRRWVIRQNFIHDFKKQFSDQVSYGAFLKGNSRDGVIEGNIVACHLDGPDGSGTRVGLSFGGGGSNPDSICEQASCSPEHRNGIMRNNLILNCSDVGIYLNEARDSEVHHNTLYDNVGIDVRFPASVVDLRNNLLTGRIRTRGGASMSTGSNLQNQGNEAFEAWFADPARYDFTLIGDGSPFIDQGEIVASVVDDFCGGVRDDLPDIGAVEYDADVCDTTTRLPLLQLPSPQPPEGPGNTVRLDKTADRTGIRLTWEPRLDTHWNLYRDIDRTNPGQTLEQQYLNTPSIIDEGALSDGAPFYIYHVTAVALCTDEEAP